MRPLLKYLLARPLLVTQEALEAGIAMLDDDFNPGAVAAKRALPLEGTESGQRNGVAIISLNGPIFRHANLFTMLCGGATVETLALDFRTALDDPQIHSIVFAIDSPGGEANGISELANMIRAANGIKPITAYVGGTGASAAYWLAAAAGAIVVSDMAILGSIGVIATVAARKNDGKKFDFVSSQSPLKNADPGTDLGRTEIQRLLDQMAEVFIGAVANFRGVTPGVVQDTFGRGGVLLGAHAVEVGMADRLGSFEQVVSQLQDRKAIRPTETIAMGLRSWLFRPSADGSEVVVTAVEGDASHTPPSVPPAPLTARGHDADEAIAALEKRLAASETARVEAENHAIKATADAWFSTLLKDRKVIPAERDAAIGAYVQASIDDLRAPLPDGRKRTSDVAGIYTNRAQHTYTTEQLPTEVVNGGEFRVPAGMRLVESRDPDKPPTKDRIDELMRGMKEHGTIGESLYKAGRDRLFSN